MDIKFKYSHIYEQNLNPKVAVIPWKKIDSKISEMQTFWKLKGKTIERTLKRVTGLSFVEKQITCYINSSKTFSDPLTVGIEKWQDMCDNFVHELIHVLLSQNEKGTDKAWKDFMEIHKDEEFTCRVHIVVHAIHLLVAEKLFPGRIKNIKTYSKWDSYVRSWKIVDEKGAQNIVDTIFGSSAKNEF